MRPCESLILTWVTVYEDSQEGPSKDSEVLGTMRMTQHDKGVGEARTCGVSRRI